MIGIGFLLALVIYVIIALAATVLVPRYLFETPRARTVAGVVVLLIFVLIPTWDIIPGKLYFDDLCKSDGGVSINKVVNVDGFLDRAGITFSRGDIARFGYKYIEGEDGTGKLFRYSADERGRLQKVEVKTPVSEYEAYQVNYDLPFGIKKEVHVIANARSRETIAKKIVFYRSGNWLQVRVKPFLGGGDYCPSSAWTGLSQMEFYSSVLKPSTSR